MPRPEPKWKRVLKTLSIQDALSQSPKLKRMGIMEQGRQLEIYRRWGEMVGSPVCDHSRPLTLRRGLLVVTVSSPVWAQQLTMLKPQLIKTLEEFLGENVVKDLRTTTRDWNANKGND